MSDPLHAPADPLVRHRVITSGPHVLRILLVAGAMIALGVVAYMLGRAQGTGSAPRAATPVERRAPKPPLPSYADLAAAPQPPPAPRVGPTPTTPPPAQPRASAPPKEDELRKKAMDAGVGGWSRKEPDPTAAKPAGASDVTGFGADCLVPPGTPIPAQTISRTVTERGGILTAQVTRDVWDAGFACLAVPAGSMVTMEVGSGVTKGQKRIEVSRPVIVRPWPRSDMVQPAAIGADATGAAGLPGRVEVPWFETGLLIGASTAVDLAAAALTGGGSLLGTILGRGIESPLDRAAKDMLERAPVITLDAGEPLLLVLRGALRAADFRS
ncbi:TrbI/VirB10 family protein [Azospirillum sp. RWY-5-1]|uniref:TrbI/VirB10 family protein n=1 Tax=Azospirillum oleiclasticum TaxID=2735135 RepID=A0ABX2TCV5_9PROT|nr:TrbI/VirB10 family protein [Azospirillum oleiclasticum]NYZ16945.1 TrbI/VirB10 family protein [Azospirillum oleiclasticum]NYZ21882.1 TrbI/VirB10 family protein [Azospirillum oleiclasticum]